MTMSVTVYLEDQKSHFFEDELVSLDKTNDPLIALYIPCSQERAVKDFIAKCERFTQAFSGEQSWRFALPSDNPVPIRRPLGLSKVYAGFPSPAEGFIKKRLDPTEYLFDEPNATFLYDMSGTSMLESGLYPGFKLVCNNALDARINDIVLVLLNGGFTVKHLHKQPYKKLARLVPSNSSGEFPIINVSEHDSFDIVGVVTGCFHHFKKK